MHVTHLPLSGGASVVIGLVVTVVVMVPLLSLPAEHFSAMAHEGARALLAVILGLTVVEIILDRHSGSRTSVAGEGLRAGLVVLIGFLGPSLFGLGAAQLISLGYAVPVLWVLVVLLVSMLFLLGRSFGWFSVPVAIVLFYVILRYSHTRTEVIAAYVVAWLLLVSGVRAAVSHGIRRDDRDVPGSGVHVTGLFGSLLWLAGALAALIVGGALLVLG
jgi:hypothetical protein